MKTTTLCASVLTACFFVLSPWTGTAQDVAPKKNDAWRNDMGAFAIEVLAVAKKSKVPDEFALLKAIRNTVVFHDKSGQVIRVILKDNLDGELHAELAKRFTGIINWKGAVDKAEIDEKEKRHVIEIKFPVPNNVPEYLDFRESVRLEIPFSELAQDKAPAKGTQFSFTGTLKKTKADDLFAPVWVFYHVGPSSEKHLVGVSLTAVAPSAKSK